MAAPRISVIDDGKCLNVMLDGGCSRAVTVETLWSECPGALARRRRIDGRSEAPHSLTITGTTEVGYGVHIAFSADSHGGVFPWATLIDLAMRPQIDDFITPGSNAFTEDRLHGRDHR